MKSKPIVQPNGWWVAIFFLVVESILGTFSWNNPFDEDV